MTEMKLLFVDATTREESRTYQICQAYLEAFSACHTDLLVEQIKLAEENLAPFLDADVQKRDLLLKEDMENPIFDHAKKFAQADAILIGAPYWDCSFPSILKIYLEHASVSGITFLYTDKGPVKLCRADKVTYVTSSGGFLSEFNLGGEYINGLCKALFMIPEFEQVSAEGLDIIGADVSGIMKEAKEKSRELAQK